MPLHSRADQSSMTLMKTTLIRRAQFPQRGFVSPRHGLRPAGGGFLSPALLVVEDHYRSDEAKEIASKWAQFVNFLCMTMTQDSGEGVCPVTPRNQSIDEQLASLEKSLVDDGVLTTQLRIPDTIGDILVTADMRNKRTL